LHFLNEDLQHFAAYCLVIWLLHRTIVIVLITPKVSCSYKVTIDFSTTKTSKLMNIRFLCVYIRFIA